MTYKRIEQIGDATLYLGDCIESMQNMPEKSVHTCVTSPPYFGLRDYGHDGQIGLEPTPDEYVERLVEVFREVRRVLRDDGTLWLNLGDSYSSSPTGSLSATPSKMTGGRANQEAGSKRPNKTGFGLAPKQLIGVPWRVAFALQSDGWYLRQDIIWHKPNPMPESVKDRCTKAHEYIFLLSKSPKYYFDNEAIKENAVGGTKGAASSFKRIGSKRGIEGVCPNSPTATHRENRNDTRYDGPTRNRRDVWTVATKPFKGAHFATFPPDLIEPCVLAGCPEGGTIIDPFGGSGTVGLVAVQNNRKAVLCELNPDYIKLAESRIGKYLATQKQEVMDL